MHHKLTYIPSVTKYYKCPLCDVYLFPPIFQCVNGHCYCKKCFELVGGCDTCKAPMSDKRHSLYEKWAETLEFPCECEINGCKYRGHYKDVLQHQKVCRWTCCNWVKSIGKYTLFENNLGCPDNVLSTFFTNGANGIRRKTRRGKRRNPMLAN